MRGREAGQSGEGGDWRLECAEAETPPQPRSEAPHSGLGMIQSAHARVDLGGLQPEANRRFVALQRRFGRSLPVTSAYRSPEHNRKAGGAKRSRHMHGDAVDIDVSGCRSGSV